MRTFFAAWSVDQSAPKGGDPMWFRNLRFYRLLEPMSATDAQLHDLLLPHAARDAGALETHSIGWVSPLGRRASQLAVEVSGAVMICSRRVDKVLPNGVVNDRLEERVAELEEREGREVKRRERGELREAVIAELLPRAFVQSSQTFAWIDRATGWVVVDAASERRAEELIEKLRESLGSFRVRPIAVRESPSRVMTNWLGGEQADMGNYRLLDTCELRDPGESGGVVRCRNLDLVSDEIRVHLENDKQAVKLGLEWSERMEFLLSEDLSVKRLRFSDQVQEEADQHADEDAAMRFMTEFNLMVLEMRRFLPELAAAFGGLVDGEKEENDRAAAA